MRRRILDRGAGPISVAAVALAANAAPSLAVPCRRFPATTTRLPGRPMAVALTFDDGPHPRGTPAVLEALARARARATFFVMGEQVRRHRGLLAEIAAAGHQVGLHGDRHRPHALMLPGAVARDLERGKGQVEDELGSPVSVLRAPYGAASIGTLAYARRHRLELVGWTRWGWDWRAAATAASITARACRSLAGGEIILLHDSDAYAAPRSWQATAAALPQICARLEARGLASVRLCDQIAAPRD